MKRTFYTIAVLLWAHLFFLFPQSSVNSHPETKPEFRDYNLTKSLQQLETSELTALPFSYQIPVTYIPPGYNDYTPGNCTWYLARVRYVPVGLGNADTWVARAQAKGMATGSEPRPGAIAASTVSMHVAYVEQVYDAHTFLISEMNTRGLYSMNQRIVTTTNWYFIY